METPPGHMYGVISWQSNANFMCIAHFPHISRKLVYIWKKEPNQKLCKPISDGWNFLDQGRNQTSRDARASQKWEILSWETRVRQTLVPSWAQVFAPKKQRAWPGGQCKASVHCPADVPQHHPNTDCNLQPACSIATPTAAGARTAHTPSSLTAHTASNSSFANRIPQLGGENSRFFFMNILFLR